MAARGVVSESHNREVADGQSKAELVSPDFPAKPYVERPKRIFISNLNSIVGSALVEELRNDHLDFEERQASGEPGPYAPTQIVGTLSRQEKAPVPNGVTKIIKVGVLHAAVKNRPSEESLELG